MRGATSVKIASAYLAKKQWKTAIAICIQALKRNPNDVGILRLLAKALVSRGQMTEAITAYNRAIKIQPDRSDLHAELGLLYSQQNQLETAAWYYLQALSLKSDWAELRYSLALVLYDLGNWESAIENYQEAIALKPNYAAAYYNLGVVFDRQGDLNTAIDNYRLAIEYQPNYVNAYSNLGSALAKQKNWQAAIEAYQQALQLNPVWGTLYNNLGQTLLAGGKPQPALAAFERAIVVEPKMSMAHYNLGKLWQQQGDNPKAIECFERALQLDRSNIWLLSDYARVLMRMGKLKQALEYLRGAIDLQPVFVEVYCQRASTLEKNSLLDRLKISCALFLQALRQKLDYTIISHHLSQTYYYLGEILFEYGGIKQAEFYYQNAIQLRPEGTELYLRLGDSLAKQQRLDAAASIYYMGLSLEPNHPRIVFQLGKVLEKQQRLPQAIDYYERVLAQDLHDQGEKWQNLPNLFLSKPNLPQLPKGIYYRTEDWIRECELDDFYYVQTTWGEKPNRNHISPQHQPASFLVPYESPQASQPQCGGVTCNSCMARLIGYFQPVQIGKGVYVCSMPKSLPVEPPFTFVVTIPGGVAWIAPQKSEWMICNAIAIVTPDGYLLGDVSRSYPWYLPGCQYQQWKNHALFSSEETPPVKEFKGKVAILSGLSAHVYYHWTIDVLPRIELLRRSGIDLKEIDYFVVNNINKSFQKETLKTLGIPDKKIICSDLYPHIKAKELIVPSFPGHLDWVPPQTVNFLRSTFLGKTKIKAAKYSERIYISRINAKYRQVLNEIEVTELLGKYGFTIVWLEKMSVAEQAIMFANAKFIIAPHGAGLTNLVFCSQGTKVIEFFSPNYVRSDYWMISHYLQLQHYYLLGTSFDCYPIRNLMYQNSLTEDILVNLEDLKTAIEVADSVNS